MMRSPTARRTGALGAIGSGWPFTTVPLREPTSTTSQPPPGAASSTACNVETPGSSGGPDRSISGSTPRERLRRPIVICPPSSRNVRGGQYCGNVTDAMSGPSRRHTSANHARSAVATTDHGAGAACGLVESCPQTSQNRAPPSSASPQAGQCRAEGGVGFARVRGTPHSSQ